MNLKQKLKILILTLAVICIGTTFSNAAIEISSETVNPHTGITIDTAFNYCYNMRAFSSSLGANSLDTHLSTSKDWGAAAYLGVSGYGNVSDIDGNDVIIGTLTHQSTTLNATGVMDFGKHNTLVAINLGGKNKNYSYNWDVYENRNTKYVDNASTKLEENRNGMAIYETNLWYGSFGANYFYGYSASSSTDYSYSVIWRKNILGYSNRPINSSTGAPSSGGAYSGESSAHVTYRPVIWNPVSSN